MTRDYIDFAEYIARHYHSVPVLEVGIGANFKVFEELRRRDIDVRAVDINPASGDVIMDDILKPDMDIYEGCALIYSVRPPPELVPYIERIAFLAGADLIVRPLSTDDAPPNGELKNYKSAVFYKIKPRG